MYPPAYAVYMYVAIYGIYGAIIVPYCCAKILAKSGESERFWFYVILLANFWALLVVLLRPSFRKGIESTDVFKITAFAAGYWILIVPVLFVA